MVSPIYVAAAAVVVLVCAVVLAALAHARFNARMKLIRDIVFSDKPINDANVEVAKSIAPLLSKAEQDAKAETIAAIDAVRDIAPSPFGVAGRGVQWLKQRWPRKCH